LLPPDTEQEDKTVLPRLTDVTREFGGVVASSFIRFHSNIVKAPHKPFNRDNFINALNPVAGLPLAMLALYWLLCRMFNSIYLRVGIRGRHKLRAGHPARPED